MKLLACYYEVLKQRNVAYVPPPFSVRVFKDILRDSCNTMSCLTLKTMMQMTRLQFKRKRLLLKLPFVCYSIRYVHFSYVWIYRIFLFGQKRLSGTLPLILTLHLWENLSRIRSSQLMSPVSELSTTLSLGGWLCLGLMYGSTFHGWFSVEHACVNDVFVASG